MATATITIPDPQLDRIADSFGWPATSMPGEAKGAFVKRHIITMLKAHVARFEANKASESFVPPVLDAT